MPKPIPSRTIGFIGAGNMCEALVKGLIAHGNINPSVISVSDRRKERLPYMAERYNVRALSKNYEVLRQSDILFLSVKPQDFFPVLKEIAPELTPNKLVISIAAGISTTSIEKALIAWGIKTLPPVIRAMPNTPALAGEGITAITSGRGATKGHMDFAKKLLSVVGDVVEIEDETLMDVVTGLSGSGPAYVFLFMDALAKAGIKAGIPEEQARALALKTTLGSAVLAFESKKTFQGLIKMVASPGGTTIEGLKALEGRGFEKALKQAVLAAAGRSKELSKLFTHEEKKVTLAKRRSRKG
ncbi:MAG: pyrroline-5-carboxylate reductase [Deltaproteobacteria bacterium]|nr:pyrroline-5-carboxylate reductase [Deltaproteobacteria bacterium]